MLADPVLRRLALARFLLDVQFWFPTWLLLLLARGIDLADAVLVDGMFQLLVVALELPTARLADRLGYRRSLAATFALTALTFVAIARATDLRAVVIAWSMWALLWALSSGLSSAYSWELVLRAVPTDRALGTFARLQAVSSAAALSSLLTAGLLFQGDPSLPFLATAACGGLGMLVSIRLPETPRAVGPSADEALRTMSGPARRLVAAAALLLVLAWTPRILLQPLALDHGWSSGATGLLYFVYAAGGIVGGLMAGPSRASAEMLARWGTVIVIVAVGAIGTPTRWAPWIALPVLGLGFTLGRTGIEVALHRHVLQDRATVLSAVGLLGGIGLVVTRPAVGMIADAGGAAHAFLIWAGCGLPIAAAILSLLRRTDQPRPHGKTETAPARSDAG